MAKKGPKTQKGQERKLMTGDGRKRTPVEKAIKEADKAVKEAVSGKKKRAKRKK